MEIPPLRHHAEDVYDLVRLFLTKLSPDGRRTGSIQPAAGNKAKAANSLGMSRATIYRKIHEYGVVTPTP